MAVNKGEIGIYGVLRRDGGDNILARTDQVQDAKANKTQEQLNQEALNKAAIAAAHIANIENPHSVNKSQVGLGNVTNDAQVKRSEMGANNGVATLDSSGKVVTSQLPSFVDDVLEFESKTNFPVTGESGKIYVSLDTNLTYRWTGTQYTEISTSIALGETSSTAYAGDKGKALATQVSALENTVRNIPDITLISVDQTAESAADGTAVTIAFKKYDRANSVELPVSTKIPAATSSSAGVMSKADKTKLDGIVTATDAEIDTIFTEGIA